MVESVEDEMIDGIAGPPRFRSLGERRCFGLHESPVFLPFCSFFDPLAKNFSFVIRELAMGIWRRHHLLRVIVKDAFDEIAFLGLSGNDGKSLGIVLVIKPKIPFTGFGIRPVAVEAGVGKDGQNVPIEADFGLG